MAPPYEWTGTLRHPKLPHPRQKDEPMNDATNNDRPNDHGLVALNVMPGRVEDAANCCNRIMMEIREILPYVSHGVAAQLNVIRERVKAAEVLLDEALQLAQHFAPKTELDEAAAETGGRINLSRADDAAVDRVLQRT